MDDLYLSIKGIIDPSLPLVSNLSNISALLFKMKDLNWAGFYLVEEDFLYLGPFQGDVACTIIKYGKGVCGTAFKKKKTIVVDDVNSFPGHIACSSLSKSEIVTPIIKDGNVVAVIDIDSPIYCRFEERDKKLLERIAELIAPLF